MGNEQSGELVAAGNGEQQQQQQHYEAANTANPAERAALRRLESTHLTQEEKGGRGKATDNNTSSGAGPGPNAEDKPDMQSGRVTASEVNTEVTGSESGSLAAAGADSTAKSTTNARNAKAVHVADSKEGDRRKFYHPSVESTNVGEADATVSSSSKEDKFAAFVKWMKENGAEFPDQHLVKYTEECRGVHAKKDIPSDKQIAYIPLKLLIHEGHGQETDVGSKVWNSPNNNVIVPAHTQVIIYMLISGARDAARGKECSSFFAPYFRILPENFDCFPIFWTEDELSWLAGSDLVQQIRDRRRNIVADYHEVSRICPSFGEKFTEDDFLWCRTAVGSRNFGININGVKRTTMVPWADMLNHFRPRETSWTFSNEQQGFTMTSLKPLTAGQQIMDSYGKKCNSKFLMHYGFAIEKNREEDGKCMNEMPLTFALEVSR